jgi:nifR3 family TIM-barrel protein
MHNYHHPVTVGGVELPGNIFLAPVAGYSDAAFRSVCAAEGADLCYTEMVSAEALTRGHAKTRELLARAENEREYAIQLFGSKPGVLASAAGLVLPYKPLFVDLNCGCPVPKIVRAGAGSALMKTPALLGEIVAAMKAALSPAGAPATKATPVTVKIRLGWEAGDINYREVAGIAVEAGAAAVTLHARTRAQGYSGKADWKAIASLAAELSVPVFGSGDIFSAADALAFMEGTGAAGVMIARGAMGNPFIFRECAALLEGREPAPISVAEKVEVARRHLELSARFLGERTACVEFRKQLCSYTKGSVSGAALRSEAVRAMSVAEFEVLFRRWLEASRAASAAWPEQGAPGIADMQAGQLPED